MPEESTTPDLVELTRRLVEAGSRRHYDAFMSLYGPDAVLKLTGLGTSFEGLAAIRGFWEDWSGAYEEVAVETEEILDLGNGVTFAVVLQKGRPVGSGGWVQMRAGSIGVWAQGVLVRHMLYTDIDEARAAAERLAESRG
jgi:ketosteroid isomerase-like protein